MIWQLVVDNHVGGWFTETKLSTAHTHFTPAGAEIERENLREEKEIDRGLDS